MAPMYICDGESEDLVEIKDIEEIAAEESKPFYGVIAWRDDEDGSRNVRTDIFDNFVGAVDLTCEYLNSKPSRSFILVDNRKDFDSILRVATLQCR